MTRRICEHPGCSNTHESHGLCNGHRQALVKRGDAALFTPRDKTKGIPIDVPVNGRCPRCSTRLTPVYEEVRCVQCGYVDNATLGPTPQACSPLRMV